MRVVREYRFPAAVIRVYADRTCREFPLWCMQINVTRDRAYVASALRLARSFGYRVRA